MNRFSLVLPVTTDLLAQPSPVRVLPDSPKKLRQYVERFATWCCRELRLDGVPFDAQESRLFKPRPYEAYLFHTEALDREPFGHLYPRRCFGASCFIWKEWTDHSPGWSLNWVWIHPFFRRRGHLERAWPDFQQRYGNFHVQPPFSASMQRFLDKHDYPG